MHRRHGRGGDAPRLTLVRLFRYDHPMIIALADDPMQGEFAALIVFRKAYRLFAVGCVHENAPGIAGRIPGIGQSCAGQQQAEEQHRA